MIMNGYAAQPEASPWAPGSSFAVLQNAAAPNPIFDAEVRSKIERLLRGRGHEIAPPEQAQYTVTFHYAIDGRTVVDHRASSFFGPAYYVSGTRGRTAAIGGLGYTATVPEVRSTYVARLSLHVRARGAPEEQAAWIGDTYSEADDFDLRNLIDYLLVATFEHWGEDTRRFASVTVKPDDPRVLELRSRAPPAQPL